jgi:superfamily II DNA or RNA helicase
MWRWDGAQADPLCSCPVGPLCKHAYALARAIEAARDGGSVDDDSGEARRTRSWESRVRDARRGESFAHTELRPVEGARSDLVGDLEDWAHRRVEASARTLRAVFGLDLDGPRPLVWMEVRVTTPRLTDAARSSQQVSQLAADLRRDPHLLAPPHARLLRVLAGTVMQAEWLDATGFALKASTLNRLLDSFSESPLATWGDSVIGQRGAARPGSKLKLGDATVDIVPVCSGEGRDLRITLAARWSDGRHETLEEIVYLQADDDLHPSLVLADGAFWRVAEEPPPRLMRRLESSGSLPVPEHGRERFLALLASSFESVGDALAPHMRVHRARPVVTLDLDAEDWIHVRAFAHTGGERWRPGDEDPATVVFELDVEGQWIRLESPTKSSDDAERDRVGVAGAPAASDEAAPEAPAAASPPAAAAEAEDGRTIWVEVPDPASLVPVRQWLARLPLIERFEVTEPPEPRPRPERRGAWIRVGARTLRTFAETWEQRPRDVEFLGNRRMRDLLGETRSVRPRMSIVASGVDWLTVSAEWEAEGRALTDADLEKLRSARTRFVKLASGWIARDWLEQLDASAELLADLGIEAGVGEQRLSLSQLAQARPGTLAALERLGAESETVRTIERLRDSVRGFKGVPRIGVPAGLVAELRPYQRDGLDFLAFVTDLGMGAILADDMGLGKTVQALAWIQWLRERDPEGGPVLVVCPASVVHNWQRESARFTPGLKVLALGSGKERHAQREEVPSHDVVITNYALLRRDLESWRSIPLRAAILDEAQNVKNPDAAVSRAVRELNAPKRLALTGTPLENRALDLWSIMQFVNPGYLGSRAGFVARYDRPDAPAYARRLLAARLRPVMIRRLKEQVAPELPERIEETRECELAPGQRRLYLAELLKSRATVARFKTEPDGVRRNKIEILAALTRLRQVCCHPALAGGRESLGSGKFDALFELLDSLLAEGHKVLVFSQFVECLRLLEAEMTTRSIKYHLLIGATTKREQVVTGFEQDPDPCVFLISLKAGGSGLNLTAASYVVLFDPWWNPAVEAQAIDRAHRIGQTRTVIAYRLIAAGTIEEKIWELKRRKGELVAEVLGEEGFAKGLTAGDLDYLLG